METICYPSRRAIGGLASLGLFAFFLTLAAGPAFAIDDISPMPAWPWWAWAALLFLVTFTLGILAVLGGVGGGVLFVPIVSSFFPFHLDFVRGAGLLVALSGTLAAGPGLLRGGLASLRLAMPLGLIASTSAVIGAMIGLTLPVQWIQMALGITILGVVGLMLAVRKSEYPVVPKADALSAALRMNGIFYDPLRNQEFEWRTHRTPQALLLFGVIGLLAGMFGLGAGWANVPALNLVMGVPLKVSVATSNFMLSIVDAAAAWVYIHEGAILVIVTVPSVVGMMLGAMIGVRLLTRANATLIRRIMIIMLLLAGLRALAKGFGY